MTGPSSEGAPNRGTKLSIIIPAFNERDTIEAIIERVRTVPRQHEIIVVDDGSTDGTQEILQRVTARAPGTIRCIRHGTNQGKGAAIQSGLAAVTGEVVIVQDADLEYHPEDYPAALRLIDQGWADAVYGSRFLGPHRVFMYWHYLGNRVLTTICNVMTSSILSDMETGFKVIRADVLRALDIRSRTFDVEVELTVKLFRFGYRVYEMPITYTGRTYREGKKITWTDGVRALVALVKWGALARPRGEGAVPREPGVR
ncbi:MAG: glycosyltransferase family 2 protein [Alphaproteobacteria bacterium]